VSYSGPERRADHNLALMRNDAYSDWPHRLLANINRMQPSDIVTAREITVLTALSYGMTVEGAGELIGISPHTVQAHYQKAKRKLRAKNRTHAVALALRQGLI
jgi:DNA-binding CsgD family transcriptional regulator